MQKDLKRFTVEQLPYLIPVAIVIFSCIYMFMVTLAERI